MHLIFLFGHRYFFRSIEVVPSEQVDSGRVFSLCLTDDFIFFIRTGCILFGDLQSIIEVLMCAAWHEGGLHPHLLNSVPVDVPQPLVTFHLPRPV